MRKTVHAALLIAGFVMATSANARMPAMKQADRFDWPLPGPVVNIALNDVTQVQLGWSYPYVRLTRRSVFEFSIGNFF